MIRRAPRRVTFTVVDNDAVRDERLSFKARGLLIYLLSLPDDWTVTVSDLANRGPDGKAAIRAGLTELAEGGYLEREQVRGPDGRFHVESVVHEEPCAKTEHGRPIIERNRVRFSVSGNRTVSNNHLDERKSPERNRADRDCPLGVCGGSFVVELADGTTTQCDCVRAA